MTTRHGNAIQTYLASQAYLQHEQDGAGGVHPHRPRVLVLADAADGGRTDVGRMVMEGLVEQGVDASFSPVERGADLAVFDAFVIGSGVHSGHWSSPVRSFVYANRAALRTRTVWLFTSEQVGQPMTAEGRAEVDVLLAGTQVVQHHVFAAPASGEPSRCLWVEVRAWTATIAEALRSSGRDRLLSARTSTTVG